MKPACLACMFLSLAGSTFAQSHTALQFNQRPGTPMFSQTRHGAVANGLAVPRAVARRTTPSQASGLNFAPAVAYDSGGTYGYSLAVADVNGDGNLDLVVSNSTSNTVGVLLANADGTFQPAVIYSSAGCTGTGVPFVGGVRGRGWRLQNKKSEKL